MNGGADTARKRSGAAVVGVWMAWSLTACEPDLFVGTWTCSLPGEELPSGDGPISVPWSTGFEDGFCDYVRAGGFCYADGDEGDSTYSIVDSPVYAGRSAAAFSVVAVPDEPGAHARCVLRGGFPNTAYYSAHYYVPHGATNTGNWNLFHLQGGERSNITQLWDVSIASAEEEEPTLYVYDHLRERGRSGEDPPAMPIGRWFEIELYLHRALDDTGEVALYMDDQLVLEVSGLVTSDSDWGQWYVGNLADALVPNASTVYVDDVTLRASP